jgi:hypothetical protein
MTTVDERDRTLFSVFGKIETHLGDIHSHIKSIADQTRRASQAAAKKTVQPVFFRKVQSAAFPASGPLVFRMEGPDLGHFWYVRQITVGGLTPTTTAAGRADIFVSASDLRNIASLSQIGLADWRDQAITLPQVAPYSRGGISLRLNEELFIIISNGTATQQYVAAAQIEDFQEGIVPESWDV